MLTNKQISELFKVPLGTIGSWGSDKPSAKRPLLYNFLKILPSEEFVNKVLNRKKAHQPLKEKQIEVLFNCRKSNHLELFFRFINNLTKKEIEELLKRTKVFMFLNNTDTVEEKIEDILKNFSLEEELASCYVVSNHLNQELFKKVLEYVKNVKEKNPYEKIIASDLAKNLDISVHTAIKYLELIEKNENIPISVKSIVKKAIEDLKKENKKPTIENIMKITGFAYATVQRALKKSD